MLFSVDYATLEFQVLARKHCFRVSMADVYVAGQSVLRFNVEIPDIEIGEFINHNVDLPNSKNTSRDSTVTTVTVRRRDGVGFCVRARLFLDDTGCKEPYGECRMYFDVLPD